MRFLAETNDQIGTIHEIDTEYDEFTPQSLRAALLKVDPAAVNYSKVLSGFFGRNRCIMVMESRLKQVRIEVYMRRSPMS